MKNPWKPKSYTVFVAGYLARHFLLESDAKLWAAHMQKLGHDTFLTQKQECVA